MRSVTAFIFFILLGSGVFSLDYGSTQFANMQRDYGINRQTYDIIVSHLKNYDKEPYNKDLSTQDDAVSRLMELLPAIYAQDKKALPGILTFLKTTFKGSWIHGAFRNPLHSMILADDFSSFKDALKIDANLAYAPNQYWESSGPTPIAELVRLSKLTWLLYLYDNKFDFNREPSLYGKGESIYILNLFSVVSDPKVDAFLVKAGVPEVVPRDIESYCIDDNVRVRDSYSLNAKVLFKINKNTPFVITGQSSRLSEVEGLGKGFWYRIKVEGKVGWIFSAFAMVEL